MLRSITHIQFVFCILFHTRTPEEYNFSALSLKILHPSSITHKICARTQIKRQYPDERHTAATTTKRTPHSYINTFILCFRILDNNILTLYSIVSHIPNSVVLIFAQTQTFNHSRSTRCASLFPPHPTQHLLLANLCICTPLHDCRFTKTISSVRAQHQLVDKKLQHAAHREGTATEGAAAGDEIATRSSAEQPAGDGRQAADHHHRRR